MLWESMGTLHLYELLCKVQKHLGRARAAPGREFWNFTASQVGSEVIGVSAASPTLVMKMENCLYLYIYKT